MARRKGDYRETPLYLTPLEEDIITLLGAHELYPIEIERAYKDVTGRSLSEGTLYPTLRKLEKRGFLTARWGSDRADDRFGGRRRYYRVIGDGFSALHAVQLRRASLAGWAPAF